MSEQPIQKEGFWWFCHKHPFITLVCVLFVCLTVAEIAEDITSGHYRSLRANLP
jgi:hypothetical protein